MPIGNQVNSSMVGWFSRNRAHDSSIEDVAPDWSDNFSFLRRGNCIPPGCEIRGGFPSTKRQRRNKFRSGKQGCHVVRTSSPGDSSNMWLTCAAFPGFTQASPSRHKTVRLDTFQSYVHCQSYHHKIRTTNIPHMTCCYGRCWNFECDDQSVPKGQGASA